ncbi:MAG TPA: hypothetical protein VIL97_07200, partial [Thermoanaerobaculia bacterium]
DAIRVLSFARSDGEVRALPLRFPRGAMLAAIVSSSPRWVADLERALPIHIAPLLAHGALFALYGVEDRPLFPRPFGVVAFPADEARADELESMLDSLLPLEVLAEKSERTVRGISIRRRNGIGFVVESARVPDAVVVAFDKSSIERYLADTMSEAPEKPFLWSVRLLPRDVVPVLEKVKENPGMRLVARDLSRGAERIYRSARWFESAESIVSTATAEAGRIRLETVISAPK